MGCSLLAREKRTEIERYEIYREVTTNSTALKYVVQEEMVRGNGKSESIKK